MDSTKRRNLDIVALLDEMAADVDGLTDAVVAAIRRDAPAYQAFPFERHRADSVYGVAMIVAGLRSGTGPTPEALQHVATIGRDRARFGIPLLDAVEGYHVVYRELWNHLLSRALSQGPDVTAELSREVALLWTWVHRASAAFAAAHSEETARVRIGRQEMRTRLVALLLSDEPPTRLASSLAVSLGFDVGAEFVSLCTDPTTAEDVDAVNQRFAGEGATAHCALDTTERAVVVGQGIDAAATAAMLREVLGARVGIGTRREGIAGAALSLADAGVALAAATSSHPVVDFAREWTTALLTAQPHRIEHVVAAGRAVARDNPHLAEAVTAFADSRFSITAAAGVLHVHPNTVKYRLERWAQLTGWDAFTVEGLAASRVAIGLAETSVAE